MKTHATVALASTALLSGCAGLASGPRAAPEVAQTARNGFEQDRAAILAMAGEFEVQFQFEETLALRSGYALRPPHRSSGHELVMVVEDSGRRIVLQHVLVDELGRVIKHWRQDWLYEQTESWRYAGDNTWRPHRLGEREARGTWTQEVWQVDDSPRYAGAGRWSHDLGTSSWTSEPAWRPLPRREHTTRSDYDVLVGVNRHTITPWGWAHEQDNLKLDRKAPEGRQALAREIGVNSYRRVSGYDFSPGREYWAQTALFWRAVRAAWIRRLSEGRALHLREPIEGRMLWERMFGEASSYANARTSAAEVEAAIARRLDEFVQFGADTP